MAVALLVLMLTPMALAHEACTDPVDALAWQYPRGLIRAEVVETPLTPIWLESPGEPSSSQGIGKGRPEKARGCSLASSIKLPRG